MCWFNPDSPTYWLTYVTLIIPGSGFSLPRPEDWPSHYARAFFLRYIALCTMLPV